MTKTIYDELIEREDLVLPGNTSCPGCGSILALRYVLKALGKDTIIVIPASCSSVYQAIFPYSSIKVHIFNTAFASAAAVASGLKHALVAKGYDDVNVLVWGGDGGLIDIGFATVSGAAERNEDIIVAVYDNEAYMNTGIQRSGSTPPGAITTTTYAGKSEEKKPMPYLMLLHGVPYVATASSGYPLDLYQKVKKARNIHGFRFLHIFAPCPPGWRFDDSKTVTVAKLAVETGYWILWEAEQTDHGLNFSISGPSRPYIDPARRKPLEDYLMLQGRFRDISPEKINLIKKYIDNQWEFIKRFLE
ncbi:MAG: 3-methyl-2-oxobutanoate dehydrogenase subunit beta [Candidatus Njordarchaeia archaeon]|nr:3-methyl-2-oxobutanoate dehydrogenase subunit beta [Candidatus Korarchaeota archaeon]RLC71587.1 MAG: pyruvate synthase subunit beta [Chloroflexota bacterium]